MIFRLDLAFGTLDAQSHEIVAQARQWTLVQKAGEIIRSVRQQFPAPDADEQIEKLTLDPLDVRCGGCFGECRVRDAERRRITAQRRKPGQQPRVGSAAKQNRQQRIFACARSIDLVDRGEVLRAIKIWT